MQNKLEMYIFYVLSTESEIQLLIKQSSHPLQNTLSI